MADNMNVKDNELYQHRMNFFDLQPRDGRQLDCMNQRNISNLGISRSYQSINSIQKSAKIHRAIVPNLDEQATYQPMDTNQSVEIQRSVTFKRSTQKN